MLRIALVSPDTVRGANSTVAATNGREGRHFGSIEICPPTGLMRLAGAVADIATVQIYQQLETNDELVDEIVSFNPDLVGFRIDGYAYSNTLALCRMLKSVRPVPIVTGGPQISGVFSDIFRDDELRQSFERETLGLIDYVVAGEGERPFRELVSRMAGGQPVTGIEGLGTRAADGTFALGPRQKRLTGAELDAQQTLCLNGIDMSIQQKSYLTHPAPSVIRGHYEMCDMSRGCPYDCTFCENKNVWRQRVARRSPERVIEEVRQMIGRGTKHMFWTDEDTFSSREWAIDVYTGLAKLFAETGHSITTHTQGRVTDFIRTAGDLNEEGAARQMLQVAAAGGCEMIAFGLESGADLLLQQIHKHATTAQSLRVGELMADVRTFACGMMMVGLPEETETSLRQTEAWLEQLGPRYDRLRVTFAIPFPGTALWMEVRRHGLIEADALDEHGNINWDLLDGEKPIIKTGVSRERLVQYMTRFLEAFHSEGHFQRLLDKQARFPELLQSLKEQGEYLERFLCGTRAYPALMDFRKELERRGQ